jgi:hypothetical protein
MKSWGRVAMTFIGAVLISLPGHQFFFHQRASRCFLRRGLALQGRGFGLVRSVHTVKVG